MSNGSELMVSLEQGGLRIQRVSSTGAEEKHTPLPEGRDRFFARLADQDDYEFEADDQGSITHRLSLGAPV